MTKGILAHKTQKFVLICDTHAWIQMTATQPSNFVLSPDPQCDTSPASTKDLAPATKRHHRLLHGHHWSFVSLSNLPWGWSLKPGNVKCHVCAKGVGKWLWRCQTRVCEWEVCENCKRRMGMQSSVRTKKRLARGKSSKQDDWNFSGLDNPG